MMSHAWFDARTVAAVLLSLAFTVGGLGRPLPIRTTTLLFLLTDTALFIGYLYLLRSLIRVPIAWRITRRQMRKAQTEYHLSRREAFSDGLLRGVYDRRRWEIGQLALLDRFSVVGAVLLATTPVLGALLVRLLGILGVLLLILLYLFTGSFALLVGEAPNRRRDARSEMLPFIDLRDE